MQLMKMEDTMNDNANNTPIPVAKTVWYKNATFWTNVITVSCLAAAQFFGIQFDPKLQAGLLAIINILLRTPSMATTQAKADLHNKAVRARIIR